MKSPTPVKASMKSPAQNSPFRPGGRGSKQLSKAIEQTKSVNSAWVLCSQPPCFARVMSTMSSTQSSNIMIQPLRASPHNSALLVPWDGHLLIAKSEHLHKIQVCILKFFVFGVQLNSHVNR